MYKSCHVLVRCWIKPVAKNLGVWFDSNLSFEQHTTLTILDHCTHLHLRTPRLLQQPLHLPQPKICLLLFLYLCSRIDFNISLLTFKALHGLSSCYMPELLVTHE